MSEPDQTEDYYVILGADSEATRGEIERLYKRKAVLHHPDRGGSEEEMKRLNQAYHVLKDDEARRSYDTERQEKIGLTDIESAFTVVPAGRASPAAQLDAITHQLGAAALFLVLGLVLLFVVRFQYVIFLWPLALLAFFMIVIGIVQAHSVMDALRQRLALSHPARRYIVFQEAAFWSVVLGGGYGVYLILTGV